MRRVVRSSLASAVVVRHGGLEWDGREVNWADVRRVEWVTQPSADGRVSYDTAVVLLGPTGPQSIFTGEVPNLPPVLLELLETKFNVTVKRQVGGESF